MNREKTDFLVIGSGLAGLSFALKVADWGQVTVISKESLADANTVWAQGGIASVSDSADSFSSHISDTLIAGAGLCKTSIVENYIQQAPDRIKDLIQWGVPFDQDLTREGGHSHRRVFHFEDHTGTAIHQALLQQAKSHPQIQMLENHLAIDLITNKQVNPDDMGPKRCIGAYILNKKTGKVLSISAKVTVLATGGAGKVYLYTTNWSGATGDGVAMGYRAGARVSNLEFMQFHPTCLYHPEARNFLISEALRGEGGELINSKGDAFMKKHHPSGSLAPRDIVARGIDAELKQSGEVSVYLDMRKHHRDYLKTRFPVIYNKCLEFGIDISQQPIPVVPAAHYLCGGVMSDVDGQTDLVNLYALGETASTGFHGANRLASNSLLECICMAHNCAEKIRSQIKEIKYYPSLTPDWIYPTGEDPDEMAVISHMWDEIRRLMWNYVGIVRTNKRLTRAHHRLQNLLTEVKDYYSQFQIHSDIIELRNIAIIAELTVRCALMRKESRGIHYNLDYPWADQKSLSKDSVVW